MEKHEYLLSKIYDSEEEWIPLWHKWSNLWHEKTQRYSPNPPVLDETLTILISYGDSLYEETLGTPLQVLYKFLDEVCDSLIQGVHILPYFDYTSDDGFSISNYRNVRKNLGTWKDIERLATRYKVMTDLVLNHCSSKHEWFQKFLQSEKPYTEYFIDTDPSFDYSMVVRPRPHFVLNEYDTKDGPKHVWTTFSRDQVDLNFANPEVLFEMLDTLLEYVLDHGSRLIRLDAIAYLWKELGTPCIHHPKTHLVVQLMRAVLDQFAPNTVIITETNVPHKENISYFGDNNEAHMVYQFPLPPLLLYSMITENTEKLQTWASTLPQPTIHTSYFNFCASHDGIGITPTHGILNQEEQQILVHTVKDRGGLVSYKSTPEGDIPYELNINYLSAVSPKILPVEERAKIFIASQAVVLAMPGVPGIYIHSLIGSENWNHGVKETGHNRTINRQQLQYNHIVEEIYGEHNLRNEVFTAYLSLITARQKSSAFHPAAPFKIISVHKELFVIIRQSIHSDEQVLCIINISSKEVIQEFDFELLPWSEGGTDLVNGDVVFFAKQKDSSGNTVISLAVEPYEIMWLCFNSDNDTITE